MLLKLNQYFVIGILFSLFSISALAQTTTTVAQISNPTDPGDEAGNDTSLSSSASAEDSSSGKSVIKLPSRRSRSGFGVTYSIIGGQTFTQPALDQKTTSFDVFDSYISFNYRISRDIRIGVRPAFGYSVEGQNKYGDDVTNKSRIRDLSFIATFYNTFEDQLPSNFSLRFQPRLYLPTSDFSKEQGTIAKLRLEESLNIELENYHSIYIYAKPNYYFQRSTTYINNSIPGRPGLIYTTPMIDSEHGVAFSYSLNKTFSIVPALNFEEDWSNSSPSNQKLGIHKSVVDYRIGLGIEASRQINFLVSLQNQQDLINTKKPKELSYSIIMGGSLF